MRKALSLTLLLLACISGGALAADLNDPTRPSGFSARGDSTQAVESTPLVLTFIRLGDAPLAVINGQNLRPGQTIGGYRLQALQANSVTLVRPGGGSRVLTLSPTLQKSLAIPTP